MQPRLRRDLRRGQGPRRARGHDLPRHRAHRLRGRGDPAPVRGAARAVAGRQARAPARHRGPAGAIPAEERPLAAGALGAQPRRRHGERGDRRDRAAPHRGRLRPGARRRQSRARHAARRRRVLLRAHDRALQPAPRADARLRGGRADRQEHARALFHRGALARGRRALQADDRRTGPRGRVQPAAQGRQQPLVPLGGARDEPRFARDLVHRDLQRHQRAARGPARAAQERGDVPQPRRNFQRPRLVARCRRLLPLSQPCGGAPDLRLRPGDPARHRPGVGGHADHRAQWPAAAAERGSLGDRPATAAESRHRPGHPARAFLRPGGRRQGRAGGRRRAAGMARHLDPAARAPRRAA